MPDDVEVVEGYVGKPDSLAGVFNGIDTVYLAPVPAAARKVAILARDAGVRRFVTLTGGPGTDWYGIEADVEASGLEYTHLEPGEFMTNATIWQSRSARRARSAARIRPRRMPRSRSKTSPRLRRRHCSANPIPAERMNSRAHSG